MGKRTLLLEPEQDDSPLSKRANIINTSLQDEISVSSANDLKKLFRLHQDDIAQYRINLQGFRRYLERQSQEDVANNRILLEFLTSSINTTNEEQVEVLPDIFQAWRYAVQVHDDGLMPSIPHTLAILLKTISSTAKFSDVGILLCETISSKENSHIFQKSLHSTRVKDTTIARCLDLLTQAVSFDGGACARDVWLQRGITLHRLPQFLGMSKKSIYGVAESTSIRDHAIPYLLANLRFQGQEAKADVLSNRKALQVLLRDIINEKPVVLTGILSVLRVYVLEDSGLPRSAKGHLLTDGNLASILGIMRHEDDTGHWQALHDTAEAFLLTSCTSRTHGIVYRQHGLYPPGTEELTLKEDVHFLRQTYNTKDGNKYQDRVPVRNTTLAAFIQDLRPWASLVERRLILGIFEAAPELIADYFVRKKAFSFEPKLTATWVGWATFIYSVLNMPLSPQNKRLEGRVRSPPPSAVVLQNILPQPLAIQSLSKALKHTSDLIKLLTLRILIASFQRLQSVLADFQAEDSPMAWQAAAIEILDEFRLKCPDYKQLLGLYQATAPNKHILREGLAALIALYNTVMPQLTSDVKFDVSLQVTRMLNRVQQEGETCAPSIMLELEHLLQVGGRTLEAKWWQKPEASKVTSVTIMLQLLATARIRQNTALRDLLGKILAEDYIITSTQGTEALELILDSLATLSTNLHKQAIYEFLDDCLVRVVRKPVKYHGDAKVLLDNDHTSLLSPILMALLEQWPFFVKAQQIHTIEACAEFLCGYLLQSVAIGTPTRQLEALRKRFYDGVEDKQVRRIFKKLKADLKFASPEIKFSVTNRMTNGSRKENENSLHSQIDATRAAIKERLAIIPESQDHPALISCNKKDVLKAVLDHDIAHLINYLASSYSEIRTQAIFALRALITKVQSSKYEERQALYLLLGILLETIAQHGTTTTLPSMAVSFAARSVAVLNNPLHPMYSKINHFLSRAPVWDLAKMPSYWMDRVFHKPPTQIDAHWKEVDWLLDNLIDGMRSPDDVNLYRRTGVFERILVNCTSISVPRFCYDKAIDLLYRTALVGGATTLITRFGVLAWIATQKLIHPKAFVLLSALEGEIRTECDADRIRTWSGGRILAETDDELDAYQLLGSKELVVRSKASTHTA